MRDRTVAGLGALALGVLCACGSGESAGPEQRSMVQAPKGAAGEGENRAPVVSQVRLAPSRPAPGEPVEAQVAASDPDGDAVRLEYRWMLNGRALAVSGPILPAGSFGRDDRIEVSVVASDGSLESQEARARASVEPRAPTIVSVSFDAPENAKPGDPISALVDVSGEDDASLRLEYTWLVNGKEVRQRERTLATEELKRGDRVQVKVRARDGDAVSETMISKELMLGNSPPAIAGIPKAVRDGDAFRYEFAAQDPDGDRSLRWRLTEAPAGMTIDPLYGVATWRPTKEQAGKHVIAVEVTDNHGLGSQLRFEVTASVTETPAPAAGAEAPAPAARAAD